MSRQQIFSSVRIIPKETSFLEQKVGSRGEIFFDQDNDTLRLFDGVTTGGTTMAKTDLTNVPDLVFKNKASAAGIAAGTTVAETPPAIPGNGELWFDSATGVLYLYYDDGTSGQWIQPAALQVGGGSGGGATALSGLTDVQLTSPSNGQVLKYNGTKWVNGTDNTSTGGGGGSSFSTISVSGQNNVVATSASDTLTLQAGSNITITTDPTSDTITIAASSIGGATNFTNLSDVSSATLSVDKIYLQAIVRLTVTNSGTTGYLFNSHYTGTNPTIYAISGTTIAFNLQASGHPFAIQDPLGNNYNNGLIHVTTDGVVTTGSAAQGKTSGTLYWNVPKSVSGTFRYQCLTHPAMVGGLTVKDFTAL